jgi:uncharacterized protein YbcC (UPF0753/DUF2309 family)
MVSVVPVVLQLLDLTLLQAELLALPGWAGIIHELEKNPLLAPHEKLPFSLTDFVALRLVLTVLAVRNALGSASGWREWTVGGAAPDPLERVAVVFDGLQALGISSADATALGGAEFVRLAEELIRFDEWERRRLLHLAYERRHERMILLPLTRHLRKRAVPAEKARPVAQMIFCIDDREESIRRAIEETDPRIQTFGAAGFFGCAIDYIGIDDANSVSLCPIVVKPGHSVVERPAEGEAESHQKRRALRRLWSQVIRSANVSSQTLIRGFISTVLLGLLSLFPLVLRVLSPLAYGKAVRWLNDRFLPDPRTELQFMRNDAESRQATEGLMAGFAIQEMVDRVAGVLGPAGLRAGHARIVMVLGHGSTSINNPHESAYDCGACGGRRGGPNARLFASKANHPAVRLGLSAKGIEIPDDTWFIGGYHDTCSDQIELFDLELLPSTHARDLAELRKTLDRVRALSAHERTRRFELAGTGLDPETALRHVMQRAEHLGEPRPEYGHSTNAVAFVGRRETTRGLFFDRRAFLISYDRSGDPETKSLAGILGAVIPVCGGINLEYYFSRVDNEGYGCGTKLPHNITGLIGVMNGMQGDLRTGLTWQMVEIHEPVRILFVVENSPENVLKTIRANPLLNEFLENRWIRLATLDTATAEVRMYRGGGVFEPVEGDEVPVPNARTSVAYYSGKLDHLPVAEIDPGMGVTA